MLTVRAACPRNSQRQFAPCRLQHGTDAPSPLQINLPTRSETENDCVVYVALVPDTTQLHRKEGRNTQNKKSTQRLLFRLTN